MSLGTLLNLPDPRDVNGISEFSFSNQDSHIKIVGGAFSAKSVNLQLYIVDPMVFEDRIWLQSYDHQALHNDMNAISGYQGNDLTSLDWEDEQQRAYWAILHWQEHMFNEQFFKVV